MSSGAGPPTIASHRLRWGWVGGGTLIGAALLSAFLYLVDPALEQPVLDGFVLMLTVVLTGMLVGYRSRGETIREAGLAGLVLLGLTAALAIGLLRVRVPPMVWIIGPFYATLLAMMGGWVGEILQGTLEEAHEDRPIDWPWIFVSVTVGLMLSTYGVLVGRALFDLGALESVLVFIASFMATGWIVGFFSAGSTVVEPAIAALLMIVVDAAFIILWLEHLSNVDTLGMTFGGAAIAALLGGWLGEKSQRVARPKRRL